MPMDYVALFGYVSGLILLTCAVHGSIQTEVRSIEGGFGKLMKGISLLNKISVSFVLACLMVIMFAFCLDWVGYGGKWALYLFEPGGTVVFLENGVGKYYSFLLNIPLWNVPTGLFNLLLFFGFNIYRFHQLNPNYSIWLQWQNTARTSTRNVGFNRLGSSWTPVGMKDGPSLLAKKSKSGKKSSDGFKIDPNVGALIAQVVIYLFMVAIFILFAILSWLSIGGILDFFDRLFTPNGFEAA